MNYCFVGVGLPVPLLYVNNTFASSNQLQTYGIYNCITDIRNVLIFQSLRANYINLKISLVFH